MYFFKQPTGRYHMFKWARLIDGTYYLSRIQKHWKEELWLSFQMASLLLEEQVFNSTQ